ncbi:MAG: L-histidine N(alpha)-methyltransferase [Myxococcota bacterium]|nr:L-histidine N(alpha)-methyltransferase [Myxococcota bacterium]
MTEKKSFLEEVIDGLSQEQKTLPCKYLYDARGSLLFEEICELDEYYPTRTELAIMHRYSEEVSSQVGEEALLIEYGSGSSRKTRLLLDSLREPSCYVPIDISPEILADSAAAIAKIYPDLEVHPLCADYLSPVAIPIPEKQFRRRVVYFPGSTIGNFEPVEALEFLARMARQAGSGGGVLIGVDLRKDSQVLERAYDDARGVTAQFDLNLLVRMNRELGADFPLDDFRHTARWEPDLGRVEMRLVCKAACRVDIAGHAFDFSAGEYIHTESAYKYDVGEFASLATKAGLSPQTVWTDDSKKFSIHYLTVPDSLGFQSGSDREPIDPDLG